MKARLLLFFSTVVVFAVDDVTSCGSFDAQTTLTIPPGESRVYGRICNSEDQLYTLKELRVKSLQGDDLKICTHYDDTSGRCYNSWSNDQEIFCLLSENNL